MDRRLLLLLVVLSSISACRKLEESDSISDGSKEEDRLIDSGLKGPSSKESAVSDPKFTDKEIDENTDIAIFLKRYSPTKGRDKIQKALGRSNDRVKLAQGLLNNYSGGNPSEAASILSMTMWQWPGDFTAAIIGGDRLNPSEQELAITSHASVQEMRKNVKGLKQMYSELRPGAIRERVAGNMAYLNFKEGGIESALASISNLDFTPEKHRGLDHVLSQVQFEFMRREISGSQGKPTEVNFSSDDIPLVKEYIEEWENSESINKRLVELKALSEGSWKW